jgi:hypothetical protein
MTQPRRSKVTKTRAASLRLTSCRFARISSTAPSPQTFHTFATFGAKLGKSASPDTELVREQPRPCTRRRQSILGPEHNALDVRSNVSMCTFFFMMPIEAEHPSGFQVYKEQTHRFISTCIEECAVHQTNEKKSDAPKEASTEYRLTGKTRVLGHIARRPSVVSVIQSR